MPRFIQWISNPAGTQVLPQTIATASAATAYMNQVDQQTATISGVPWSTFGGGTSAIGAAQAAQIYMSRRSSGSAMYWIANDGWYVLEDDVTPAQYASLAQQRAEQAQRAAAYFAEREHDRLMAEQRHIQERQQRHDAAHAKSRELLLSHLTPAQRKTFEENEWFVVQGGKSKKEYRIRTTGYTGNIDEMRGERVTHRLCGHLRGNYALHDHHVAQKISLEWDEEAFVALCNRHVA